VNWQKLESALGAQFQVLKNLCPEGWGGNTNLATKFGPKLPPGTAIHWKFIHWEVDVRIENAQGDAEYQTSIRLQNITDQRVQLGPMHSLWAPNDAGVSVRDIRAFDQQGQLEVVGDVQTPTFMTFRIKARRPIPPGEFWRYWWEISWPKAYANWDDGDLTYKGEGPANELILKVVLPRVVKPLGQPSLKTPDGKVRNLSWVKLHGRDAIVFCEREVPISESIKIRFKCVRRKL
jgi:hypothetical protein